MKKIHYVFKGILLPYYALSSRKTYVNPSAKEHSEEVFNEKSSKLLISSLLIFIMVILLQSCVNKSAPKSTSVENDFELLNKNSSKNWKEQLEFIKSNRLYILKINDIQLIDYGSVNKINKDSLESIVAEITNGNSYIPYQKEGSDKINVIKFSELLAKNPPDVKIDLNKQKEYLKRLGGECLGIVKLRLENRKDISTWKVGKKILEKSVDGSSGIVKLRWKVGKDTLTTNCFVSDDQGIVFDNLLSNIKVLKEGKIVKSDTVSTSRTKKQITYTIEKTWTLSHWSSTLSGKTRSSDLFWGVGYKLVQQNGSIIDKEIIGLRDLGARSATIFDGGQGNVGVTSGQWDNKHADFNLKYWFSVNDNLTTTFTSNSEYTFGPIVSYIGQETKSVIKRVTLSDL